MGPLGAGRCITLQMQGIAFNHLDRSCRYDQIVSTLHSCNAALSFPNIFRDQHQLKGFYRLISNKAVDHSTFIRGYQSGLISYSREQDQLTPWLLVQDTMLTDFHSRKVLDLGYTQTERSNGFLLHHGLLLNESATPLGLFHQQVIHRERGQYKQARAPEDKESGKWIAGLVAGAEFSRQTGRPLIHIMDREADVGGIISAANGHTQQYFVIRAAQNRVLLDEQGKALPEKLFSHMPLQYAGVSIRRKLSDGQGKTYQASCQISQSQVMIKGVEQPVHCLWVKEVPQQQTTNEKELAEWFLLTNLPAGEYSAEAIAGIYANRWVVEDFHKCYKTGCNIEKRQFDSRKTLTTCIGLLAITAVVLLRGRYLAQYDPTGPFEVVITDAAEQELAKKLAHKYLKPVDAQVAEPYTTLWWLLLLGRMGGHQGFKQKGLPGWQTLWKGYAFFQSLLIGFNLANNQPSFFG
jgi:hypothetical protein